MLPNICVPLNLDAFVLNEAVCEGGKSRIAPITQPDYVSLQLDKSVIQHDVLPPVDLHSTGHAIENPRISTVYSAPLKTLDMADPIPNPPLVSHIQESRLGVYLHWSLPRGYRTGSSSAAPRQTQSDDNQAANPVFRLVPNRWLVVRILKDGQYLPADAQPTLFDAWVVESDRLSKIEDLDGTVDLETDVTPYVNYNTNVDKDNLLHSQAETYIGLKTPLRTPSSKWSETPGAPSVPLTVLNSANPLFADYTLHNPNVFSMKDNFEYAPGKYLQRASCDYIVIGWHSAAGEGPFGANGIAGDLAGRAQTFLASLSADTTKDVQDSTEKTAVLCHGVIYDVTYDRTVKPDTPADSYADHFGPDIAMEPVSVGTTPLDSILTFLQAHSNDMADEETILGKGTFDTAKEIVAISELLYAVGDDYDSRVKASDLLSGQSFTGSVGGFVWSYDKKKEKNGPPLSPNSHKDGNGMSELDYLNRVNELQHSLDTVEQMLAISRWGLFAEFFKYCSDAHNDSNANNRLTDYADTVKHLYHADSSPPGVIQSLKATKAKLETDIQTIVSPPAPAVALVPARKIARDPFYLRSDPTLMVAGIDAGWPAEYLAPIPLRFDSAVVSQSQDELSELLASLTLPPSAGDILPTIQKLVYEANGRPLAPQIGFKTWSGQPFCPIFLEWEAIFYNVDWSQWTVELASSPSSTINHRHVRYVNDKPLYDPQRPNDDTRTMSGRILVLPQPSFALGAIVQQVLNTAGENVPAALQDADAQTEFVNKVKQLKFISGDLSGFADALLTVASGSHVKPNVRPPGADVIPLAEAVTVGSKIGLTDAHIKEIGGETGRTPFGTLVDFVGTTNQPFKGVQHGQLAITKLNIVDKFGQVVCCPLPLPVPTIQPDIPTLPIHPCLSDQLCPTLLPNNTLNTVFPTADAAPSSKSILSPFIQITPAINQTARINASFVKRGRDQHQNPTPFWEICSEWENPIFGWIVVNYADSALQFFTGDGIFYTSLRFGGPTGTMTSLTWAPFAQPPPDQADGLVSHQLVELINQMQASTTNPLAHPQAYLAGVWNMIDGAIENMPFPPSQYAAYANAIVGKPLALVNVGWSLEQAQPALKAQHTLGPKPGDLGLSEAAAMRSYHFPVKIGDYERPFDGVVCYWDTDNGKTGTTDFDKMYTYFPDHVPDRRPDDGDDDDDGTPATPPPKTPGDPRYPIDTTTFPTLTPYFVDPVPFQDGPGLSAAHAQEFMVKSLLVDPYTAVHLYTGILPISSIQLPGWTLQNAMKNMTAFFTLGPILVTTDVPPKYDDTVPPLTASSWLAVSDKPKASADAYAIKLPIAGGKGMWNWLQPYVDPTDAAGDTQPPRPRYNALQVGQETGDLRNDPAPYTFLEGFLQLARPLVGG